MTVQDAIKKMNERIAFIQSGIALERSVRSVMAEQAVRIFEEGRNTAGGQIGVYNSQDEIYVDPDTLPRSISPRGKPESTRKIQNRKTVYFKSYKDLRREVGRESEKVNLRLTNDLQSDWANAELKEGVVANPSPIKVSNLEYRVVLKRKINQEKRAGLEARYGKIFNLTSDEKKLFYDVARKEIELNA